MLRAGGSAGRSRCWKYRAVCVGGQGCGPRCCVGYVVRVAQLMAYPEILLGGGGGGGGGGLVDGRVCSFARD
eukprot:15437069-Alexandrium_andersonii.AAC.1